MNTSVKIIFSLLFVASLHIAAAAQSYTVKVTIKGIETAQGVIGVLLSNDAENFPKSGNSVAAKRINVTGTDDVEIIFDNIPAGKYAVMVMQDLNENGQLDRNGLMPTEPFGFSNLTFLMGPPTFADCAFDVAADTTVDVQLMSL